MSKQTIVEQEVEQEVEQATPAQTAPTLSIQDLILTAQFIQIISNRGGFRAEELETVGALYTKVVTFLEASGAVSRAPAEQESAESADTE